MTFHPIAIVGRSCILPGALSPESLWEAVSTGKNLISDCPPKRWRAPDSDVLCNTPSQPQDKSFSKKGGYVTGFEEIWQPDGFAIKPSELDGLDPMFLWVLHCARKALEDAGDHRQGNLLLVHGNCSGVR